MLSLFKKTKDIALMLPAFSPHDAMSNYVKKYYDILTKAGFECQIFARFYPKDSSLVKSYQDFNPEDFKVLNYHHGIGDPTADLVIKSDIPTILYYHNITPAKYYREYNWELYELLLQGRHQLQEMVPKVKIAISASQYSNEELIEVGYKDTQIIPIFFDPKDLDQIKPDPETIKYLDKENITNITYVSRFSAHKDQESLVKAFYVYHNQYNRQSRLNLVGNVFEHNYLKRVKNIIEYLGIEDAVNIAGIVPDDKWKAYYTESTLAVSMSEHEGFAVPVLEANYLGVPLLAYNGGAVKDTMGNAGILMENKSPEHVAALIDLVVNDADLRNNLVEKGKHNYQQYSQNLHEDKVIKIFTDLISEKKNHE